MMILNSLFFKETFSLYQEDVEFDLLENYYDFISER